jgi:predicted O-linked N-acetylglucosamine transferase (SPINDLY family)
VRPGKLRLFAGMKAPFEAAYDQALGLHRQGRLAEADGLYARALALKPDLAEAHNNRGAIRQQAGDWEGALFCYDSALSHRPDYVEALANRGNVLIQLRQWPEALASFDRALALSPVRASALNGRAGTLGKLKRFPEAFAAYRSLRAADPANPYALGGMLVAAMQMCDWDAVEKLRPAMEEAVARGTAIVPPFLFLGFSGDPALQLACARNTIAEMNLPSLAPLWRGEDYGHDRPRIGYLSADYCQHPVALLLAELVEKHDRSRFEVLGLSTGPDDGSAIRHRLAKAFDQFHDLRGRGAHEIAALIRQLEIDIRVDLTGHTEGDHFAILNCRAAPVQVNWLGYPGTDGTPFVDYILADTVVAPPEHADFFSESIVRLPDSYFPTAYDPLPAAPSRHQAGLPDQGFVFASFNNGWKITRPIFAAWLRLLQAVPGSVLWLLDANDAFRDNLRRAAAAASVAPERLIFAPRTDADSHLARQQLADLMLDTSPYNGHMTSSDALWTGVPLVTMLGTAFAGRVAASLLESVGMDELVTHSLDEYEALARALATDPVRLRAAREKLAQARTSMPLFDTDRMRQNVEDALLSIHAGAVGTA